MDAVVADINAVFDRDPACEKYSHCMLNFKGFQAIQVVWRMCIDTRTSALPRLCAIRFSLWQCVYWLSARVCRRIGFRTGFGRSNDM
jgi:serine acetyltransferase